MKTNLWKRAAALLLALVLCFACVGTASAAEDVSGKVYLISYPRDGDENYHTGREAGATTRCTSATAGSSPHRTISTCAPSGHTMPTSATALNPA